MTGAQEPMSGMMAVNKTMPNSYKPSGQLSATANLPPCYLTNTQGGSMGVMQKKKTQS